MENKLTRLTTEQRYALVAYLDGELNEAETEQIEKLLASSAVARTDVEFLGSTYDLLDELPRPKASSDFTEKTLATVRLEDIQPDLTQSRLYKGTQKGLVLAGWSFVILVAGFLGYAATRYWMPQEHDILVQDLETIEHLDEYTEIGSLEFLERLSNSPELMREIRRERLDAETP